MKFLGKPSSMKLNYCLFPISTASFVFNRRPTFEEDVVPSVWVDVMYVIEWTRPKRVFAMGDTNHSCDLSHTHSPKWFVILIKSRRQSNDWLTSRIFFFIHITSCCHLNRIWSYSYTRFLLIYTLLRVDEHIRNSKRWISVLNERCTWFFKRL